MENIVVPIDFSQDSLHAIDFSIILAKELNSTIHLVHVINQFDNYDFVSLESRQKHSEEQFNKIISQYQEKLNGNKLNCTTLTGKIYEQIFDFSSNFENAIAVISVHGNTGYDENYIGGNAFKIISSIEIPVFAIKNGKFPSKIEKIVMPLDVSFESVKKVPFTIEVAKKFSSEVHLISVSSSMVDDIRLKLKQSSSEISGKLRKNKIKYQEELLIGNNIASLTASYAQSIKADLVSIMSEQAVSKANVLGVYAHQIIRISEEPILIFHSGSSNIHNDIDKK